MSELRSRMGYRELSFWLAHFEKRREEDWDRTEKLEYYLMALTAEVRRGRVKNPSGVKMTDFKLEFKPAGPKAPQKWDATRVAVSKGYWGALFRQGK